MHDRAPRGRPLARSATRFIVLAFACLILNLTSPWSFAQGNRPDVWPGAQSCVQRIPWQVGLKIDGDKLCGGVLISPKWVATAGHCVILKNAMTGARAPLNPDRIRTFMGNTRRSQLKAEDYRAVKKVIVHESYIRGEDGDLALLELDGAFAAANVIAIASAADMQQHWVANAQAVVSGWGVTASGATVDDLREESVNFVSTSACRSNPGLKGDVTERMVCAGDAGKDSCFGDSGGPLSLAVAPDNVMAIGVVSFGAPNACGVKGVPGVYTKLAAFKDWITAHTGPLPSRKQAFGTCADR